MPILLVICYVCWYTNMNPPMYLTCVSVSLRIGNTFYTVEEEEETMLIKSIVDYENIIGYDFHIERNACDDNVCVCVCVYIYIYIYIYIRERGPSAEGVSQSEEQG